MSESNENVSPYIKEPKDLVGELETEAEANQNALEDLINNLRNNNNSNVARRMFRDSFKREPTKQTVEPPQTSDLPPPDSHPKTYNSNE